MQRPVMQRRHAASSASGARTRPAIRRRPRLGDRRAGPRPIGTHAPAVQHDDLGVLAGLLDQMRRPEHRQAPLAHRAARTWSSMNRRLCEVEADGRLVEQQQRGSVQQRARQLDPAALAARSAAAPCPGAGRQARRAPTPLRCAARRPAAKGRAARRDSRGSARRSGRGRASAAGTRHPCARAHFRGRARECRRPKTADRALGLRLIEPGRSARTASSCRRRSARAAP